MPTSARESTEELHRRIRADRIAILFDLNGYTAGGDSQLMVLRPAPIQVNSIGFPGTLGADWYDYILVDRFGAPEAMQPFYTERLWHMPHASYPSDTTRAPQGPPPCAQRMRAAGAGLRVLLRSTSRSRSCPTCSRLWMRLLHAVPGSVLWLLESDAEASANLRREAAAAGVDPARLVFAPKVPQERHLARHAAADLLLDSFPYGAHTTTNDALLAGLPVLTCAGETLVTRLAGSQLHAIGLPELVTGNFADYEANGAGAGARSGRAGRVARPACRQPRGPIRCSTWRAIRAISRTGSRRSGAITWPVPSPKLGAEGLRAR